jgi:preprotein translocase subunit YajC
MIGSKSSGLVKGFLLSVVVILAADVFLKFKDHKKTQKEVESLMKDLERLRKKIDDF